MTIIYSCEKILILHHNTNIYAIKTLNDPGYFIVQYS